MNLMDWFTLALHILIPSIILFIIIFYVWKFIIFLTECFQRLKRKVDGFDDPVDNKKSKQTRPPNKGKKKVVNDDQNNILRLKHNKQKRNSSSAQSGNTSNSNKPVKKQISFESEYASLKMLHNAKKSFNDMDYNDDLNLLIETFGEESEQTKNFIYENKMLKSSNLLKKYKALGIDQFDQWYMELTQHKELYKKPFTGEASIDKHLAYNKKMLLGPLLTGLDKEIELEYRIHLLDYKKLGMNGNFISKKQ